MKKILTFLTFVFLLCIAQSVYAAGNVSLSANKTSVTVGEEFTVSISLSNASVASLTARVTVDTSKVDYVSGPSNSSFQNGRAIYTWTDPNGGETPKTGGVLATFKFKAKQAGSAGFSVSGDFYTPEETAVNPIFSGVTVSVIEETPQVPSQPETPTTPATPSTPSTPSTPETPSNPQTPSTPQTPNNSGTTPSAPSTPSNNPSSGGTLSSNANLRSLRFDIGEITPSFQSDIVQYSMIVNETVTDIDVLAVAEDSNSSIDITGNHGLQMGSNTIQIIVTAQNGNKKIYAISVTKTEQAELANSLLENLAIENVVLTPEFRSDIMEYTAEVASDQESVNVLAIPQREGAIVTIEGNENLQFGENRITVMVTAEDGITTQNYTITVYRKTEEEERQEEQNAIIEEQNREKEENSNHANNTILATVSTIGIAALIGILYMKYRKDGK